MPDPVVKTGKKRGRKAGARVPCDDCIVRASQLKDGNSNLELCERCTDIMSRRQNQPEPPTTKMTRQERDSAIERGTGVAYSGIKKPSHREPAIGFDQRRLSMGKQSHSSQWSLGQGPPSTGGQESLTLRCPTHFSSLQEAMSLEPLLHRLSACFATLELNGQLHDSQGASVEKNAPFGSWLRAWETAFSQFLVRAHPTMSSQDRRTAMILKAHHIVAEILSGVNLSLGESSWSSFRPKFAAIIKLATAVLDGQEPSWASPGIAHSRDATSHSPPASTFSFGLSIFDPLHEICARCPDQTIREQALELLARHPQHERKWSSWSTKKVRDHHFEDHMSQSPPMHSSRINIDNYRADLGAMGHWLDSLGSPDNRAQNHRRSASAFSDLSAVPMGYPYSSPSPGSFYDLESIGDEVELRTPHMGYMEPSIIEYPVPSPLTDANSYTSTGIMDPSFEYSTSDWFEHQQFVGVIR